MARAPAAAPKLRSCVSGDEQGGNRTAAAADARAQGATTTDPCGDLL